MKNQIFKNKRASTPIAIVLLVLMTAVLTSTIIVYLLIQHDKLTNGIYSSAALEDIYSKKDKVDYYLQKSVDNAFAGGKTKAEFINRLKTEIDNYKISDGGYIIDELGQAEAQLKEDNIEINDNSASFKVSISLERNIADSNGKLIVGLKYSYKKVFNHEETGANSK